MKVIKKWSCISTVILIACILITALLITMHRLRWIIIFCIVDIAMIILLYRQMRLYHDASLVFHNSILCIPLALIVAKNCADKKILDEIIVSPFGLLIGSKVYKWGCDGVKGTRLKRVEVNKERIWFTFGTEDETQCIELLHGITNQQRIIETLQKLRHETGVKAAMAGYDWME